MRTHKKTPVDFRLTYMGGNNQSSNIARYAMGHETWSKGGKSGWTVKNGKRIVVNPKHAEEKGHSKIIILLADDIHGR